MESISNRDSRWSPQHKLYTMHPAGEIRYGISSDYRHRFEQYVFSSFHYDGNLGDHLNLVRKGVENENNRICR